MKNRELELIGLQRLEGWRQLLVDRHATPLLLIGVCHDLHAGQAAVITIETLDNQDVKDLLTVTLGALSVRPGWIARRGKPRANERKGLSDGI